jgi:Pentapeptide repeats (8 copies)
VLGGIAAVVVVLAVVLVLFVPAADWLAHNDVGSAKGQLLQTARDAARGRLLTLGAGLFAAGALIFTARNLILYRENLALYRHTNEIAEQGQVTDRYTKAIEQLGSDKPEVRIGGIYALERIARDSAIEHPAVMEVLTVFIREHSHERQPLEAGDSERERSMRPDVRAALAVVERRDTKRDIGRVDLTGADLTGMDLVGADLTRADLTDVSLRGGSLTRTDLTGATLTGADLTGANLYLTNLRQADLTYATLTGADLTGANLHHAHLTGADLTRATLTRADLKDLSEIQ